MMENFRYYKKTENGWKETYNTNDVFEIHSRLMSELIQKKLHKVKYIRSFSDRSNKDGTRTITVRYHDDYLNQDYKGIYIIRM